MDNGEWDDSNDMESTYLFHAFHAIMVSSQLDEEAWDMRFNLRDAFRNGDQNGPKTKE